MIFVRKSDERGLTQIDWLKSYHTFSFGEYYDERYMGFGSLRVINEDSVQPAKGFGTHSHHNMEIISYVVEGALEHKDSMGTGSIISPGEIQKMSAGTGVSHSEFNHSKNALVHFLQIWILPFKNNIVPSYEQKVISKSKNNQLLLLGSPEGGKEVIHIHQNVYLYTGYLQANNSIKHDFKNSKGWLQVVKGNLMVNNNALAPGDGAGIRDVSHIEMKGISDAEFLLFDLA